MAYAFTGLFLNNVLLWLWVDIIDVSRFAEGILSILKEYGVSMTGREFAGYAGPFLNMGVVIPINYLINKFWAYRQK